MKILAKDIKNKEIIKYILDLLKPMNEYIDTLEEDSFEYNQCCDKIADHYLEIDEALFGCELITQKSTSNAMLRSFTYWAYIKGEINWNTFVKRIKKYSNTILIDLE
jgi:hypothetical protein